MAEIPLSIPAGDVDPPLALNRTGLPADALSSLKSGATVSARVIKPLGAGKFLLNVSGAQVTVESRLVLSAGQQLSLAAREVGTRILLDIVRSGSTAAGAAASSSSGSQPVVEIADGARAARSPAAPAPTSTTAPTQPTEPAAHAERNQPSSAARTVQNEARALLSRSAPFGEIVAEVKRIFSDAVPARVREIPAPGHSAQSSPPSANSGAVSPDAATPQPGHPPPAAATTSRAPTTSAQPSPPDAAMQPPPSGSSPAAQVEVPSPTVSGATDAAQGPAAQGTFAPASPTPATPASAAVSRELIQLLQSLVLELPPEATQGAASALELRALESLPTEMRELLSTSPQRLAQLLTLIETRAAESLSSLPEAARIEVLIAALDRLPPPAAPTVPTAPAATPPATEAALAAPSDAAGPARDVGALVERLLALLSDNPAPQTDRAELPAQLRTELQQLDSQQRGALSAALASREETLLQSSPQLQQLGRAHQALLNATARLATARAGSLASSAPGASFSYVEIPTSGGGDPATARLRVMVRRDGPGTERGQAQSPGSGKRSMRAVMDLSLSGLGEVWSELILSGEDLAVRIQLPDPATRDMLAPELPGLEGRLEARGFRAQVTAEARPATRPEWTLSLWPDTTDSEGVDLWA
jgi:Flagellar hook-length control protein FliK